MNGAALREGRHVRRRHDRVVDRLALRHVLEILLLEAERGVLVQHEVDRLAVVFLHQLLELHQRLVEGVVVVELHGAVERDDLLGLDLSERGNCREQYGGRERGHETTHGASSRLGPVWFGVPVLVLQNIQREKLTGRTAGRQPRPRAGIWFLPSPR